MLSKKQDIFLLLSSLSLFTFSHATPDKRAADAPTCDSNGNIIGAETTYTTESGSIYQITCGREYYGGDLGFYHVQTFAECIKACDRLPGCVDVSYVNSGGKCWAKSTVTTLVAAPHVWTAELIEKGSDEWFAPLDCTNGQSDGEEYETEDGRLYEVLCGQDFAGGDIPGAAKGVSFFEDCLRHCDEVSGCVAVAFSNGQCYPKSQASDEVHYRPHVWGARVATVGGGGSSSSTSTTASSEVPSTSVSPEPPVESSSIEEPSPPPSSTAYPTPSSDPETATTLEPSSEPEPSSTPESTSSDATTSSSESSMPPSSPPASSSPESTSSDVPSSTEDPSSEPSSSEPSSSEPTSSPTLPPPESESPSPWWGGPLPSDYFTSSTWVPPPLPTGTEPACLANPADSLDRQFHLIDFKQQGFLIDLGDRPGLPPLAATEEEGQAMLDALEDWVPTLYRFESPDGGADDLYDIVVVGTSGPKRYLSLEQDGTIGFATASSPSTTTVFFAGCQGRVRIRGANGALYTVHAAGPGLAASAVLTVGDPPNDGLTVLPPEYTVNATATGTTPPANNFMRRSTLQRRQQQPVRQAVLDRCGTQAVGRLANRFEANAKYGVGPVVPNGCGSKGTEWVPDFIWTGCCDDHDRCYGACAMGFRDCNTIFLDCMYRACWNSVSRLNPTSLMACGSTATLYFSVVSSGLGRDAYNRATTERCQCDCWNYWSDRGIRPCSLGGLVECRNVFSWDNNNCGGCDWKCPNGYECWVDECRPIRS
ncbi:hypothetical protein QBC41DRAFT_284544 [Cercophora samala]|uniref:Apple domain-containing protein n=1 Tax=Cercophora samala TaxID=330535 RepID=A0AA40D7U5_9PEZI|nr:hypothetical protein QBC41DRAFT_284544 [Cercophora samala]